MTRFPYLVGVIIFVVGFIRHKDPFLNVLPLLPPPDRPDPGINPGLHMAGLPDILTMMQFSFARVPQLTATNYGQWKTDMELRLVSMGLWDLIALPRPLLVDPERRKRLLL